MSFRNDYDFGLKNEERVLEYLKNNISDDFKRLDTFSLFDFGSKSKKLIIELKSRKCKKDKYSTTLIGYNKINILKKFLDKHNEYQFILLFDFEDGLYQYIINTSNVNEFLNKCIIKPFKRNYRSDYDDIKKLYCFIPVNILELINKQYLI